MSKDYKGRSIVDAGASIAGSVAGAAVRVFIPGCPFWNSCGCCR